MLSRLHSNRTQLRMRVVGMTSLAAPTPITKTTPCYSGDEFSPRLSYNVETAGASRHLCVSRYIGRLGKVSTVQ